MKDSKRVRKLIVDHDSDVSNNKRVWNPTKNQSKSKISEHCSKKIQQSIADHNNNNNNTTSS